jgi:hypothetical protein
LRFKAISFDLLVIDGNLAVFEGTGKVNGQTVRFRVEVSALRRFGETDTFRIFLPALDNYSAGGGLSGGRITIHAK